MLRTLVHRGPDDEGFACIQTGDAYVALGSRRLAIIDLSAAGGQPMFNESGSVATVFNGEIYNFLELRDDLSRRGHRFRSRTDSEVIVHAYEEYGPKFLSRLDGMFAIALWDGRIGRLLLARDRLGKKPLYYYAGADIVVFGSEIKALLAHPRVPVDFDPDALPTYLVHGYVHLPGTFYREIVQVPPASYVAMDMDGVHPPVRYWTFAFPANGHEATLSVGEATEVLRALLRQAVRKRLISDVPLGALLSGGVDSSIVVRLMAEAEQQPVQTFTAGFADDRMFDERPYARLVAESLGTRHTEFVVDHQAADLLEKLLWYHDQPYGDSSALPTFLVCGHTRQAVTVALVGDGGDEVFAGYERFRAALLAERFPRLATLLLGGALRRLPGGGGHYSRLMRLRRFGMGVTAPLVRRYLEWVAVTPPRLTSLLLGRGAGDGVAAVEAQADTIVNEQRGAHPLHQLMYFNLRTYLHGDLLVKMDRMSMAQSLETRSPFLDTALIEFVASLPATFKIQGRKQKVLLKQAFAKDLPPAIATRPKHGFGVPIDAWFRGALRARLMDELLAPDARILSYLRADVVRTMINDHLARRESHGHRLWALLNLEIWLRLLPQWTRRLERYG